MRRTASAMNGTASSAISVRRHSRAIITVPSASTMATWRITMTSAVDDTRDSRLTSLITRDISSAECRSAKNDSGMRWMCV